MEAGNLHVCRELLLQETEAQLKYTKPPLKDTALHLAARKRDNDLVKLFIETGAFVDSQNVSVVEPTFPTLPRPTNQQFPRWYAFYFKVFLLGYLAILFGNKAFYKDIYRKRVFLSIDYVTDYFQLQANSATFFKEQLIELSSFCCSSHRKYT